MLNLLNDVAILTNVPEGLLKKFIPVCNYCISHKLYETCAEGKQESIIDLGIGELHIQIADDYLKYKFIPSKELEKLLIQALENDASPISCKLYKDLQCKIDKLYKELI